MTAGYEVCFSQSQKMVECLNRFAPAIQALSAVFIFGLTGVLAWLTGRYVQVSESLQKPCIGLLSEPRGEERAIMEAPFVTQVTCG